MPHFTYQSLAEPPQLKQGDVINKTPDIERILAEVHPHYLKPDYKYFIVLTQTCDLVLHDGKRKARYLSLAAVRSFDAFLKREIEKFQKTNAEKKSGIIIDDSSRTRSYQLLERVTNNNEPEYFYLHHDLSLNFPESCVAFLRLSIALKALEHYDTLLAAKILELRDSFRDKLGWLVGNIYSRVGTDDWDSTELKRIINEILETKYLWAQKDRLKELNKRFSETPEASADMIIETFKSIEIPSKKKRFLGQLERIFEKGGYIQNGSQVGQLLKELENDPIISTILK